MVSRLGQATNRNVREEQHDGTVTKGPQASDFAWAYTDEPHATRRTQMLQKYPQLKKLFGPEPLTKWAVLPPILLQLYLSTLAASWSWPKWFLISYAIGATLNHNLFLAIHEVSHNLAFKKPLYNQMLMVLCNFPIAYPYWASFKAYHMEHHRFQGHDGVDTDIPTKWEGQIFNTPLRKFFFCIFQILFYAIRPLLVRPIPFCAVHKVAFVVGMAFNALWAYCFGAQAWFYLICSTFFAGALHPLSGHFISEHYMFVPGHETYSYYGILNYLAWNVGYHNEHHDFPYIPWTRLPEVRKIAPEFYDPLPSYDSWCGVLWNFIFTENVTCFSRTKRHPLDASGKPKLPSEAEE